MTESCPEGAASGTGAGEQIMAASPCVGHAAAAESGSYSFRAAAMSGLAVLDQSDSEAARMLAF